MAAGSSAARLARAALQVLESIDGSGTAPLIATGSAARPRARPASRVKGGDIVGVDLNSITATTALPAVWWSLPGVIRTIPTLLIILVGSWLSWSRRGGLVPPRMGRWSYRLLVVMLGGCWSRLG
jgi:hypothetical protein